jgi:hypothetical protein
MGVALMAAGLAVAAPAQAQYMPVPVGAARMPEPLPTGPSSCNPPPNLIPGPVSPEAAPMGPPNDLSLPCNHASAFQCEEFAADNHMYLSLGGQWLQRQKLGGGVIALMEPGRQVAQEFNNITQTMNGGPRYTLGWMVGDCAVEYTGYYIPTNNKTILTIRPGVLDELFSNPPADMVGPDGTSIFLKGNSVRSTFGSSFWNNEVNFRTWNIGIHGADLIFGARYIEENENLQSTFEPNSFLAAFRSVTDSVHTFNRIATVQLGCEYECSILPCLGIGATCKGAWGANFVTTDVGMERGDGRQEFNVHRDRAVFTQVYDIGLFFDIYILERLRVRTGYNTLWLVGVADAPDQIDFNLGGSGRRATSRFNPNGSIFWHGPMVELEWLF